MFKVVCSINHEICVGVLCLGNILDVKQIPINGRSSYSLWTEKWRGGVTNKVEVRLWST